MNNERRPSSPVPLPDYSLKKQNPNYLHQLFLKDSLPVHVLNYNTPTGTIPKLREVKQGIVLKYLNEGRDVCATQAGKGWEARRLPSHSSALACQVAASRQCRFSSSVCAGLKRSSASPTITCVFSGFQTVWGGDTATGEVWFVDER